jgi:hypothetical protein
MRRAALFKALVITGFVLPGIACSGPAIDTRAAGTNKVGLAPGVADPPRGIMNREEYEGSPCEVLERPKSIEGVFTFDLAYYGRE